MLQILTAYGWAVFIGFLIAANVALRQVLRRMQAHHVVNSVANKVALG